MSLAALVRSMVNAGATPEVIALAVEAVEAERQAAELRVSVRSPGAERQRRFRERRAQRQAEEGVTESVTRNATDNGHGDVSTLSRPLPPQTPPTPTHTRDGITTHARRADPVDEIEPPPKRRTGQRLPPSWRPSPQDTAYAESQSLKPDEISRVAEDFRDYWTARAGEAGRKLDWPATWRTWVRRHIDRRAGSGMAPRPAFRGGGGQGATDFASILAERRGRGGNPDDVSAGGEAIPGAFRVVG